MGIVPPAPPVSRTVYGQTPYAEMIGESHRMGPYSLAEVDDRLRLLRVRLGRSEYGSAEYYQLSAAIQHLEHMYEQLALETEPDPQGPSLLVRWYEAMDSFLVDVGAGFSLIVTVVLFVMSHLRPRTKASTTLCSCGRTIDDGSRYCYGCGRAVAYTGETTRL